MNSLRQLLSGLLLFVALVGAPSCSTPEIELGPVDAVVLIVVDTLRADRLSCYGYDAHATPHLDALAARGAFFRDAQAPASWTIPSMGALLTSQYPGQLGLVEREESVTNPRMRRKQHTHNLPLYERTLAERMEERGFDTAAFVDQPGLNTGRGFMQGFDHWAFPRHPGRIEVLTPDDPMRHRPWGGFLEHADKSDRALIESMDAWLGEHAAKPVFVWLHLLTPHYPYDPAAEFGVAEGEKDKSTLYDGEVRETDAMIGRVMEIIGQRLGWDRTLVILTSDHGEAFGEHGTWEHGQSLHREVVHVPLLLAAPGVPGGIEVDRRVRLLDIVPTVLTAAAVHHDPAELQGADLVPLLSGDGEDRPVFMEGMLYGGTEWALIRDDRKLMYDAQADSFLFFDPRRDPLELDDLSGTQKRRALGLLDAVETTHRLMAADRSHRLAAAAPGDTAVSAEERARVQQALKSLGY
ncbi:MAG: sulfatase [bacterium]|nr:sulfatase [bacterium]